jgi:hypothetical protein
MSSSKITSSLYGLVQSASIASSQTGSSAEKSAGTSFSSSLALRLAAFEAQSLTSLLSVADNGRQASSDLNWLTGAVGAPSALSNPLVLSGSATLLTSGCNMALADPQSAYRMMSLINNQEACYKAQYSELSAMQSAVSELQGAGETLSGVSATMDNETVKAQLQAFTAQYNDWIERFDATVKAGGVLAGTQAAEVSLYELEQSVENPFNGAGDGFHGLADLGLTIDESTKLATLDTRKLDAALTTDKEGAANTLQEFAAHFAKTAELLNSPNNFIANRLDNLQRVINYVAANRSSLQAEFGQGDAAKPSAEVAKALAAYDQIAVV